MGIVIAAGTHDVNFSTETGDTVTGTGTLLVTAGGTVVNTIVNNAGELLLSSTSSGFQVPGDFADSFSATINSGAFEFVGFNGRDFAATINAAGEQEVLAGGLAISTTVGNGGVQLVGNNEFVGKFPETGVETFTFSGGTAIATTVNGGAFQMVAVGGVVSTTTLTGVSPSIIAQNEVEDGGSAISTTVNHNAIQFLEDEGFSKFTTINSGGFQTVAGFSTTSNTTVNAGGVQLLGFETTTDEEGDGPGFAFNTLLNGGTEVVEGPATGLEEHSKATSTTVNAGGVQFVFGSATHTTVNSGTMVDWTLAFADHIAVNGKGSFDFIVGSAFNDTVNNGGGEFVVSSPFATTPGATFNTTVNSGGVEAVFGGVAHTPVINPGATELVSKGGIDQGALIRGVELVQNGGQTVGTNIVAGGLQIVQAGGLASDLINGGEVEVQAGGTAFVSFSIDSGGTLELDGTGALPVTVSNFPSSAAIDFADIAFNANTKVTFEAASNLSGTLTVTNGTQSASITLLGSHTTADFHVAIGGTLVTDPPAVVGSASSPVLAAHA